MRSWGKEDRGKKCNFSFFFKIKYILLDGYSTVEKNGVEKVHSIISNSTVTDLLRRICQCEKMSKENKGGGFEFRAEQVQRS